MTTWSSGDTISSTWLNTVEKILALGTFGAVATPRLTQTANVTYDISGTVAANFVLSDTISVTVNKAYEWMTARSLTTTLPAGTGWASVFSFDHASTIGLGASAYGIIGTVRATAGTGKGNAAYFRTSSTGTFTGISEAVQAAITYDTGSTADSNSSILSLERSGSNVNAYPKGIYAYSNTAGSKLDNVFVIGSTLDITASCFQWNMRAASTGSFLLQYDSSAARIFEVDYLGNVKFKTDATGLTTGQRITGDMTNATVNKRLGFQTATSNSTTALSLFPNGTGVASKLDLYNKNDGSTGSVLTLGNINNIGYLSIDSISVAGSLNIGINGEDDIVVGANGDVYLGKDGTDPTDTYGYMHIQACLGAPSGIPAYTLSGHVPMRYDATNNKIYVYNGAWKATAALT